MDYPATEAGAGAVCHVQPHTGRWVSDALNAETVHALVASDFWRILVIQAPTGMGKTQALVEALRHFARIVVTTHRVSLVEANARRFDCRAYNDPAAKNLGGKRAVLLGSPRVATTVQSLHHAGISTGRDFSQDVLVVDEFEQVLRTIAMGDTRESEQTSARDRVKWWQALCWAVHNAPLTIVLDAYATPESARLLAREAGIPEDAIYYLRFDHRPPRGRAVRMDTADGLLQRVRQELARPRCRAVHGLQQGGVFFACSTLGHAEAHAAALGSEGHRVLLWTQRTSSTPEVQTWAKHPQSIAHDSVYDVVVASPAVSTGLSLDTIQWRHEPGEDEDNAERLEVLEEEGPEALCWPMFRMVAYDGKVFGFHLDDALQAIARVREVSTLAWWMPNRNNPEPHEVHVLEHQMLQRYAKTRASVTVVPVSQAERSLIRAYAHFARAQALSIRYGGAQLSRRLRREGWAVEEVEIVAPATVDEFMRLARAERIEMLCALPLLPPATNASQSEWADWNRTFPPHQRAAAEVARRYHALLGMQGAHTRANVLAEDPVAVRWLVNESTKAERALLLGQRVARMAMDEAVRSDTTEMTGKRGPVAPMIATHHQESFRLALDGLIRAGIDPTAPTTQTPNVSGDTLGDWAAWTHIRRHDLSALLDLPHPCAATTDRGRCAAFRAFLRRIGFELNKAYSIKGFGTIYSVTYHPVVRRALERRGHHVYETA